MKDAKRKVGRSMEKILRPTTKKLIVTSVHQYHELERCYEKKVRNNDFDGERKQKYSSTQ